MKSHWFERWVTHWRGLQTVPCCLLEIAPAQARRERTWQAQVSYTGKMEVYLWSCREEWKPCEWTENWPMWCYVFRDMTSLAIEPYSLLPANTSGKINLVLANSIELASLVLLNDCFFLCRAMFCSGLKESHEERVEIKGLDSGTMCSLLEYTYTSRALLTHSNVQRILEAASQFQVKWQLLTIKVKEDTGLVLLCSFTIWYTQSSL